jgi:3-phosphoinositide dependent protein kinase-1
VTPKKKQKNRELVLTTHRVVCIKVDKGGKALVVKAEMRSQKSSEKEKDREKKKSKDLSNNIISVGPKGEREFVILTVRFCFRIKLPLNDC